MSAHCCPPPPPSVNPAYRRVLWLALVPDAAMFLVKVAGSMQSASASASLLADAIDFFGDAANYGLLLAVLSMALAWRARASLSKVASMAGFGVFVLGRVIWGLLSGTVPQPLTMGAIAGVALAVSVLVAWMLYRHRNGDSNIRSVWICSRNDAIGNVAVELAVLGVLGTGAGWPDLLVAAGMAALALTDAWSLMRQARAELSVPARVHV